MMSGTCGAVSQSPYTGPINERIMFRRTTALDSCALDLGPLSGKQRPAPG